MLWFLFLKKAYSRSKERITTGPTDFALFGDDAEEVLDADAVHVGHQHRAEIDVAVLRVNEAADPVAPVLPLTFGFADEDQRESGPSTVMQLASHNEDAFGTRSYSNGHKVALETRLISRTLSEHVVILSATRWR